MFEKPAFQQPNPWEDNKTPIFKEWLIEQTSKEPESWSSDFKVYVDKKYKEHSEERDQDETKENEAEQQESEAFQRTLDILALNEEDLQNKKILDLGCHDGGFIITTLKKKLSEDVFGLDQELVDDATKEEYANHFFTGDFKNELPVKDVDLITSVGAISLYLDEEHHTDTRQTLERSIDALNNNGELRIGPIHKALKGEYLAGVQEGERVIAEILQYLVSTKGIIWELQPVDIQVSGYDKDVLLSQVLVIRREKSV